MQVHWEYNFKHLVIASNVMSRKNQPISRHIIHKCDNKFYKTNIIIGTVFTTLSFYFKNQKICDLWGLPFKT